MLIQFHFKNYRSFRDDAVLDLSATKGTENPHHIVERGREKILKTAAIYGANASGKTSIYTAFKYMVYYIKKSFDSWGDNTSPNKLKPTPFLLDSSSKDGDSLFEVYFTIDNDDKTYNYGFCINKDKITEEWLNYKAKTGRKYKSIFYREAGCDLDLSGLPKKYAANIRISLRDEVLVLSLGTRLKVEKLETVFSWFEKNILFMNFGEPNETYFWQTHIPADLRTHLEPPANLINYIASFDNCIHSFSVKKIDSGDDKRETYNIWAVHMLPESGEQVKIPLPEEAAGTQKMFSMYSPLLQTLENGGVLFIDELSNSLHPLLMKNFIQTFLDSERNPNNAQLIFTTHDTWLISDNLLRRDEIWFTEKGADESSKLYSLVEFRGEDQTKVRNDANYEKNYLLGKYGAIPNLMPIHMDRREA